jgi:flagellar basal body-associated protein FliL
MCGMVLLLFVLLVLFIAFLMFVGLVLQMFGFASKRSKKAGKVEVQTVNNFVNPMPFDKSNVKRG